ncbi:MAG: hypothetical protein IPI01_07515 [Ignavibacteriae bacterium]|nr:hypothetical protein [Ignavibacteriota bacterium]
MDDLSLPTILGWLWLIAPVLVGAAGGFLYYKVIGCRSGACPITSNPWASTIYGAVIGAMFVGR